jgi:ribonucleotide monophosphatase NagD (HAD superfamily)
MIGDNPVADIAGATTVGIPAILVRGSAPDDQGLDDAVQRVLDAVAG